MEFKTTRVAAGNPTSNALHVAKSPSSQKHKAKKRGVVAHMHQHGNGHGIGHRADKGETRPYEEQNQQRRPGMGELGLVYQRKSSGCEDNAGSHADSAGQGRIKKAAKEQLFNQRRHQDPEKSNRVGGSSGVE